MRLRSLLVPFTCAVIAAASSGAASAQSTEKPVRPAQPGQPSTPRVEEPVEREGEPATRYRLRRPIVRIAQDYTLQADDEVREIRTVMGDVTILGRVQMDVLVILGSVRLGPTAVVEGSLVVVGGGAVIDPGGRIRRDMVVVGGTVDAPATFYPEGEHVVVGSRWFGESLRGLLPWMTRGLLWGRLIVPDLEWVWTIVIVFFLIYLVLNTVFDRAVGASADVVAERPLGAFMTGLVILLLTIPALAIIAASVIGIAVIPFLLCGLVVLGLVGKTAVARSIGRSVLRSGPNDGRPLGLVAFVIGFALLTLAYIVPVLGFITWAMTSVIGLGAATATLRGHLRRERHGTLPVPEPIAVAPVPPEPAPFVPPPVAFDPPPAVSIPPPQVASAAPETPRPPAFSQGLAQYPRATFLDRAAAFALDCILVAIVNGVLDWNRNDGSYFFLLLAYHVGFWAWKGTTLGGIVCNLRVIRTHGVELRFVDALVRGLAGVLSLAALGLGCLWMLQDPERQTWHDKIAGTLVVKVPRDLVLP